MNIKQRKILITGATGYIGGRLIPRLLESGHKLTLLVRNLQDLKGRKWLSRVDLIEGDLEIEADVRRAFEGIDIGYFLVHSMSDDGNFSEREKTIAANFAGAAENAEKIIYLGGIHPNDEEISEHLGSRLTVGKILRDTGKTTEFRAGPIIGSGSASFEIIRYLTERMPVMVAPHWLKNNIQTIGVSAVLDYLVAALDKEPLGIVNIGGDIISFKEMLETYAKLRGLKRKIIVMPEIPQSLSVMTAKIGGYFVGLVTPIEYSLALPLIGGIAHPITASTKRAQEIFSEVKPVSYQISVSAALEETRNRMVETRWDRDYQTYKLNDKEGVVKEVRTILTKASSKSVYQSYMSIGGENGWLTWNWIWKTRGIMDKIAGGPGLRRGRRHPTELFVGDTLDFWRVEDFGENKFLRLRAEMVLPGKAWLMFESIPGSDMTRFIQTATFAPRGLLGILYWKFLFPIHYFLFSNMANKIVRGAEKIEETSLKELMANNQAI